MKNMRNKIKDFFGIITDCIQYLKILKETDFEECENIQPGVTQLPIKELKKIQEESFELAIAKPFYRIIQLNKGDVIFLNNTRMKDICGDELIHVLKTIPLGDLQGIVTECIWSEKKWWQFWKKKEFLGCNVEIL